MDFPNMIRDFPFITIFEIYWDVFLWLVFFFYGFWMSESQYIRDDHLNFHQPSAGLSHRPVHDNLPGSGTWKESEFSKWKSSFLVNHNIIIMIIVVNSGQKYHRIKLDHVHPFSMVTRKIPRGYPHEIMNLLVNWRLAIEDHYFNR